MKDNNNTVFMELTLVTQKVIKDGLEEERYQELLLDIRDNSKLYLEFNGDFIFKHSIQSIYFG